MSKKSSIDARYESESLSLARLLTQSFNATLIQNELLLSVLGSQLLENQLYLDPVKTQKLLTQIRDIEPNFTYWALFDPQGNFLVSTDNLGEAKNIPNLLQQENTQTAFKRTLQSNQIVLGRNYYLANLDTWIMPLMKAIRTPEGEVVAVLATGIPLDKAERLLGTNKLAYNKQVVFINGQNRYRIFAPDADSNRFSFIYGEPVQGKILQTVDKILEKKYGKRLQTIGFEKQNLTLYLQAKSDMLNDDVRAAVHFDARYDIWALVIQPSNFMEHELFEAMYKYLLIFAITNFIIFWLFRAIARNETIQRQQLTFKANHDSLTGLLSRNFLDEPAVKERLNAKTSALFIDLDNFKNINDGVGHHLGDKVLREAANRLKRVEDEDHLIFRLGGDEFLILRFNQVNEQTLAEEILCMLSAPYLIEGKKLSLGASIGIAQCETSDQTLDLLITQADMAMNVAKQRKNSMAYYSSEMSEKAQRKLQIEQALRNAILHDEIYLEYQPQIAKSGRLHGVEALVRWQSQALGRVGPDEFIPIAETIGLMPEIGRYIMHRALQEIGGLQDQAHSVFHLSINISPMQLLEERFLEDFKQALQDSTIPARSLTLEITESVFIEDVNNLRTLFNVIKALGVSLSLNDFGTGYSSLSMLGSLPLDELKIDKSFIDDLGLNAQKENMVSTIIQVAHNVGAFSVAEGVENDTQLNLLLEQGCDVYQGYYYAKPLSLEGLEDFILQHSFLA